MAAEPAVTVDALRLRGDARHREPLLASLDDLAWPAADGGAYLMLRRLRVRAPWWQAAELAGQDARALAASAVSGWSPAAAQAEAVRFADLAELLACLSRDLASGRAGALWYWRHWARYAALAPAEAVTRLWADHPLLLPASVARLATARQLATVCALLGEPEVARILAAVRVATGWPLPPPDPAAPVSRDPDSGLPAPVLGHWRPLLAADPTAARRLLPLIALSSAWERLPHRLHRGAVWLDWCRAVAAALAEIAPSTAVAATSPVPPTAEGSTPDATASASDAPTIFPIIGKRPDERAQPPSPSKSVDTPPFVDETSMASPPIEHARTAAPPPGSDRNEPDETPAASSATPPLTQAGEAKLTPPAVSPASEPHQTTGPAPTAQHDTARTTPTDATEPSAPVTDHEAAAFHTTQGGLFYLLNVLAHPAVAPLLADAEEPGWQRLYRLGLHLGLTCDPPLVRFLAHKLALDDPAGLAELAPLRDEARLCRLADRHFGHLAEWGPALLAVPAEVRHTRSHLDVDYPLGAVRLNVRRAGLDIDPGWLPWLGQVVRFHYVEPTP